MRNVEGRLAIAALATLASASALIINLAAVNDRSMVAVVWTTVSTAAFAGLLCYAPSGRPRRDTMILGVAIAMLIALAPEANRGTPLMLLIVLAIRVSSRYGIRIGTLTVAVAVAGVSIAVRVTHPDRPLGLGPDRGALPVALVALVVFGLLIAFAHAVRAEAAAREELQRANEALQRDAARAHELAALRERSRIAMDLHDALGHGLTAAAVQLQSARRLRDERPAEADAFLRRAEASVGELLGDLRATVSHLRDVPLGPVALDAALEGLATRYDEHSAIVRDIAPVVVAEDVARVAHRVAQEALTNAARHARAKTVTIGLAASGEDVVLSVRDDGVGFDPAAVRGHGLPIMRERINAVGGSLRIVSARGDGTLIEARLPRSTAQ